MYKLDDMAEATGFSPEQELKKFNQKAAGAAANAVMRILSTLTEPFFRKDMGERYYTKETHYVGMLFWGVTPFICYFFPKFSSLTAALLELAKTKYHVDLSGIQGFIHHPWLPIATGILMVVLQMLWGGQSLSLMEQYRNQVKAYHTRSRGVSRWGAQNRAVAIVILAVLFTFNMPAGIIFFAGMAINLKLKADQDAAIMEKYLDALDNEVEKTYMRDAAVDKCPVELTYLNHPIDPNINPEVRENIADALVGEPVQIFGDDPKPPKLRMKSSPPPKSKRPPQENAANPSDEGESNVATESPRTEEAAQQEPLKKSTAESTTTQPAKPIPFKGPQRFDPTSRFDPAAYVRDMKEHDPEKFKRLWRIGRLIGVSASILGVIITIALRGSSWLHLIHSESPKPPASVAQANPQPPANPQTESTASKQNQTTTPPVQTQIPSQPPPSPEPKLMVANNSTTQKLTTTVQTQPASPIVRNELPAPASNPQPTEIAQTHAPPPAPAPSPPTSQETNAIALKEQKEAFNQFVNYGWTEMKSVRSRLETLPNFSDRQRIFQSIQALQGAMGQVVASQQRALNAFNSDAPADKVARMFQAMTLARDSVTNSFLSIETAIARAGGK